MPDAFTIRPATNSDHMGLCTLFEQVDELAVLAPILTRLRKPLGFPDVDR